MRVLALLLLALTSIPAAAKHAGFDHYTFALTWQPGICQTEEGCRTDQPHAPLIGLHGLWASLPSDLVSRGVTVREWWSRGCDYYDRTTGAPPISSDLDQRVEAVMPQFQHDLLEHEYDKHVACFGFDPASFFSTELSMRDAVASSDFGRYLTQHAGQTVDHSAVVAAFTSGFATDRATALQLQCGKMADGTVVLTQFWMTIPTAQLASFPQSQAFMATPPDQDEDNCPQSFRIPAWPS
jgi:ribonuclease I (enterobacter ribonuclease)